MESIDGSKGHKQSKLARFLPSEREGVGLAVGSALLWCKLRDSSSASFFTKITDEVSRCMESDRTFSREVVKHFVQNGIFGGIPQYAVEKWIQRECLQKTGADLIQFTKDTVQNFLYPPLPRICRIGRRLRKSQGAVREGERGRHFAVQAAWRARRMDTGRLSLAEHLDRPRRESWH